MIANAQPKSDDHPSSRGAPRLGKMARLVDTLLLAIAALVPALLALHRLPLADDGAHDELLVRALGLGVVGPMPTLEPFVAAPFLALPLGTLAFRLAIPSALAAGLAGLFLFRLTKQVLVTPASTRLGTFVAVAASLATTLSPPWQLEATAMLSATLPAAAILGLATFLASAPGLSPRDGSSLSPWRTFVPSRPVAIAALASLAVVVLFALARHRASAFVFPATDAPPFAPNAQALRAFLRDDVGLVTSALGALGVVLAVAQGRGRPLFVALAVTAAAALVALFRPAPGPERYDASALLFFAGVHTFAAVAMARGVVAVARLRLPLAAASAAMVAVFSATFAAVALDESSLVLEARASLERVDWAESAFGSHKPGSLVVTEDPVVARRLVAAWLAGDGPEASALLPLYDIGGRMARAELQRDDALRPLVRDVTLVGALSELALGKLAETRPVAALYSPSWDKGLTRHLTMHGFFDAYEVEPRGALERRKRLDEVDRVVVPLARALAMARAETLSRTTARLLGVRALALVAGGERDNALLAAAHAKAFSRDDVVGLAAPKEAPKVHLAKR